MSNPSSWARYLKTLGSDQKLDADLANFAARYRFAKSLVGIDLLQYAEGTTTGYFVVTRLAFAYTALEALERAIGRHYSDKSKRIPIVDFAMASRIVEGDFQDAQRQIVDAGATESARRNIQAGLEEMKRVCLEDGNVRSFVEGLRNSIFHGKYTPHKSGLESSKVKQRLILSLSSEVLKTANGVFDSWVKDLANSSK